MFYQMFNLIGEEFDMSKRHVRHVLSQCRKQKYFPRGGGGGRGRRHGR